MIETITQANVGGPQSSTNIDNADLVVQAVPQSPVDMMQCLKSTAEASYQQDIKEFLAKPIILRSGVFSGTITPLFNNLLTDLFQKDIWQRKLQGFLGIRATVVVRLQLNANKFQQGRLIMAYVPGGPDSFYRYDITPMTQLPHVEMDINSDTSAIIEIPYVTPYTHFNLLSGAGESAYLCIRSYLPFQYGAGSSTCDYTIWCSLKDVELVTPALNTGFIAQSGISKKNIRDKEVSVFTGPVSSALSKLSSAATTLSGIPYISSYANTVSWVSAIGAKVAAAFGYSIPRDERPYLKINRGAYAGENNADGLDSSDTLGLMTTNCVQPLPGLGGTDFDEMSLQFLQQISTYWTTITWNTSQIANTVVYAFELTPANFVNNDSAIGTYPLPVGFLGKSFRYYRGSLIVKLKIAKTQFHSGRLIVSFSPNTGVDQSNWTNDDSAYLFREILDVRDATEYTFTVPYVSTEPYLETTTTYGKFAITVLNPLVAPDTVSSSIDMGIEIAAGPDMEWAYPQRIKLSPTTFYAQSGLSTDVTDIVKQQKCLGASGATTNSGAEVAGLCIGERVMSIKQLLNRWCFRLGSNMNGTTYRPFDIYPSKKGSLGAFTASTQNDYITIFGSMYRFNRGSVNYKVYSPSQSFVNWTLGYSNTGVFTAPVAVTQDFMESSISDSPSLHKVSVNVPMYSRFHTRTSTCGAGLTSRPLAPDTSPSYLSFTSSNSDGGYQGRYAADDYQLGFFIGIPPCTILL